MNFLSQSSGGVANFWVKEKRGNAIGMLASIGDTARDDLTAFLASKNNIHRNAAALALHRIDPSMLKPTILPILLRDLKDRSIQVKREAVLTISEIGAPDKTTIAEVISAVKRARNESLAKRGKKKIEGNEFLRAESAEVLGGIKDPPDDVIDLLIDELRPTPAFPRSDVYFYAGHALASWKKRSVPGLIRALRDKDMRFRSRAGWVLGLIGTDAKPATLALQHLIFFDKDVTDPANKEYRQELVHALLSISPESKDKVFANFVFTTDVDVAARNLGSSELSSYLIALQDENKIVRKKTAMILGKISPAAQDAIPGLTWALFDPEPQVGREAAIALRAMGPLANETAPYLVDALTSKDADLRIEVATTLGRIGKLNLDVLMGMLRATKDKDRRVRKNLKEILTKEGLNYPGDLDKAIETIRDTGD